MKDPGREGAHHLHDFPLRMSPTPPPLWGEGEPSGTAGIPMLNVLEKLELRNIVAVVTRYFGGTKLGTGGLIRAYSNSVSETIKHLGIIERRHLHGLKITLSYQQYQIFSNFLNQENLQEYGTTFLDNITTFIYIEFDNITNIIQKLTEFYNGKVTYQKSDSKIIEIPYIQQ